MKAGRESGNGVLLAHAFPSGGGCCAEFLSNHSVPFHGGQQIPIAVAVSSALASVAVVSLVGLGERIPIKVFLHAVSRAAFSGPRASFP
jgi:hypothetical protein